MTSRSCARLPRPKPRIALAVFDSDTMRPERQERFSKYIALFLTVAMSPPSKSSISYAQDLPEKLARDCRSVMTSPFYQALFGVLTGRGADVIVVDDPMKAGDALSRISAEVRP